MTSTTLTALGTYAYLATRRSADLHTATATAGRILDDIDRSCSRFRPDSDLTRANAAAGRWVGVDPLLVTAVRSACEAAWQTRGLVNPLLGRRLTALGYDRDFRVLRELGDVTDPAWLELLDPLPPEPDVWLDIGLDPDGGIKVPADTALDLGATGKAWASDVIASAFTDELEGSALVSLGGDIAISAPDGHPWLIGISTHPDEEPEAVIGLDSGGLATSSTRVRRWSRRGVEMHHLLDPRTGQPVPEVWQTVSATGPSSVAANTASTVSMVLGEEALPWLAQHRVSARLVARDGRVVHTGAWPRQEPARAWSP